MKNPIKTKSNYKPENELIQHSYCAPSALVDLKILLTIIIRLHCSTFFSVQYKSIAKSKTKNQKIKTNFQCLNFLQWKISLKQETIKNPENELIQYPDCAPSAVVDLKILRTISIKAALQHIFFGTFFIASKLLVSKILVSLETSWTEYVYRSEKLLPFCCFLLQRSFLLRNFYPRKTFSLEKLLASKTSSFKTFCLETKIRS